MGDWANLHVDILFLLVKKLVYMEDFVSFCSVCKSWRSMQSSEWGSKPPLPSRSSWVMLPEFRDSHIGNPYLDYLHNRNLTKSKTVEPEKNSSVNCPEGIQARRFYSLTVSKPFELELPEATQRRCIGAGYGWLLTIGYDLRINVIHPFSRQQISLPHMLTFKEQYDNTYEPQEVVRMFVTKVVMSCNPRHDKFMEVNHKKDDCVVVASYGQNKLLAFSRIGDEVWTDIDRGDHAWFQDIIYYNGIFHAVSRNGFLVVCEIENENSPKVTDIAVAPPLGPVPWDQKYLFESSGVLFLICHFRSDNYDVDDRSHTIGFGVFKLEKCDQYDTSTKYMYKWTEVKDLGGKALFLGNNVTTLLPSSTCVKANCIYFAEDDCAEYVNEPDGGGEDTGIYDMEKNTIEYHYVSKFHCPLSPPLWYV